MIRYSLLSFLLLVFCSAGVISQPVKVEIVQNEDLSYTLLRNGEPYFIKGAGSSTTSRYAELASRGGNSVRTWGVDASSLSVLNEAQAQGLTVMLGLWVNKERDGFNYNDSTAVKNQLEKFRTWVLTYKDHPALLAWGIGNEVDIGMTNLKVWNAINDISKMIHEEDGNHPTLTITAGISVDKANAIAERAPDLDMLGVNSYAGISSVHTRIVESNWDKPYVITEWGVNGPWEVGKTSWGAPYEPDNTKKAQYFTDRYINYIAAFPDLVQGSYAFLWGSKYEGTQTWFGLFIDDETTEMIDALQYLWTGSYSNNLSPKIQSLKINGKTQDQSVRILSRQNNTIQLEADDPENDILNYEFLVLPETGSEGVQVIPGATFKAIPGIIENQEGSTAKMSFSPEQNYTNYRLYGLIRDNSGHVASQTFPFRTEFIDDEPHEYVYSVQQDAYVRDGVFSNNTLGSEDFNILEVKKSDLSSYSRESYLQFNLTGAPLNFDAAVLELYGESPKETAAEVYGLSDQNWNESTISWDSRSTNMTGPLAISLFGSYQKAWHKWDIGSYIKTQLSQNKNIVSLIIKGKEDYPGDAISFNSKETNSNTPRIRILTGTQDLNKERVNQLKVYPNPVLNDLHIQLSGEGTSDLKVNIYNILGEIVYSASIRDTQNELKLSLNDIPSGIYFLVISTEESITYTSKFIKTRTY